MAPETTIDPHNQLPTSGETIGRVLCYVCETDITPSGSKHKHKSKDKDKGKESGSKIKPGLVEISSEGTGFAQGGDNMARKKGVAFQC
jgi:nitric oxide synthase-interacting protein